MGDIDRALFVISLLERAIEDVKAGGARADLGRVVINHHWQIAADERDPLALMVRALEMTRECSGADGERTTLGDHDPVATRAFLAEIARMHFSGRTLRQPDAETLAEAIARWPDKGSRTRWPAVYALARALGIDKKDETLKREIKRHEERLHK